MCLFESSAVESALEGESGLLNGMKNGKTLIDLTTNHFDSVLKFHEAVAKTGGAYLEALVFGSVVPATKGVATVVASGDEKTFLTCKPLLEKFGKNIFHLLTPSSASKMKLINNFCLGSFMATL